MLLLLLEQQRGEPENNPSFEGYNPWFERGYGENPEEEYQHEHDATHSEEEGGGDEHNPEVHYLLYS